MGVVEVREISVRVPGAPLRRLDLTVRTGEAVLVAGDAGGSTLVRTLAGSFVPAAGAIRVGGDDVTGRHGVDVGLLLVPAGWAPLPALTVRENVLVGARGSAERAAAVLARLPLLAPDRRAADLTPQEARVLGVAVALARRPRVVLLDGLLAAAGGAGYLAALGALRAARSEGVATVVAERAAFDGRAVVLPERVAPEQYDRVYVVRDGTLSPWTP